MTQMTQNIGDIFIKNNLPFGRMVSFSKSAYRNLYPDNEVYFNANIITETHGKVWYGDIDITFDSEILKRISDEIGEPLYVLREIDARFENENLTSEILIRKSVWSSHDKLL